MDCKDCFFSELIDGVLSCNRYGVDVCLEYTKYLDGDYDCLGYVSVEDARFVIKYYNVCLKDSLMDCYGV